MESDEILERLIRIEDKLDAHLDDHKKRFDFVTKALIPATSIGVSILTTLITYAFKHK